MKTKPLTFLLALTFLFLFSGSVYGDMYDDMNDAYDALERQDFKTAHRLLLPLAVRGHKSEQYNLGTMYEKGQGVPQDYKEAVKWWKLAAEPGLYMGHTSAQSNLGTMYENGKGVPQDYKEASKWYRLAAERGDDFGQHNLGRLYFYGQGVLQDYALAHMWFNLSASNGNKEAIKNRNIVEKKMSPFQIEKAQEMARNWKPKK
jgi:uncharacterized protein